MNEDEINEPEYIECINPDVETDMGYFLDCACGNCDYDCIEAHESRKAERLNNLYNY
ncbi:MAG: hypothetical protein KAS32_17270 [Candidatus Peribacteraceae bacterium]|nr:hypothetical protein [Candidatus Peribacteraceae bacterium]